MALHIGLLVLGAGMALHVETAKNVSESNTDEIVSGLAAAIEARTGVAPARSTRPPPDGCPRRDRCATEIRGHTRADEVVFLRVIGGPSRIRLAGELVQKSGDTAARVQVDLTPGAVGNKGTFEGVAAILLPDAVRLAPPPPPELGCVTTTATLAGVLPSDGDPEAAETKWAPWVVLGASAVAAGVGAVFGVQNVQTRDDIATKPHTGDEVESLQDQAFGQGLAANLLIGTAAVGLATSVVWAYAD